MKIIPVSLEMSIDKMYCPSTDEVIFSPEQLEINEAAEAFVAYWHGEVLNDPLITDPELNKAWEEFREGEWQKFLDNLDLWEGIEKFLTEYKNPEWIVYECTFHGMACGPVSSTVYYVVKKDTVIEEVTN